MRHTTGTVSTFSVGAGPQYRIKFKTDIAVNTIAVTQQYQRAMSARAKDAQLIMLCVLNLQDVEQRFR